MEQSSWLSETYASFMDEKFWLPKGYTWKHLEEGRARGLNIPHVSDLQWVAVLMVVVFALRFILERFVFKPLGQRVLANRPAEVASGAPDSRLPALFKTLTTELADKSKFTKSVERKKYTVEEYKRFASLTGVKLAKVTEWCKAMKEANELITDGSKWTETCWRLFMYVNVCVACWLICWPKDWLWNTRLCWRGYPYISIEPELQWLYLVELAIYCNLMITQFFDVRREDFVAMLLHHIATIGLITFSYLCNYVRAGTLVLLCHDISDVFLEAAKLCKYAGRQLSADIGFAFFALSWLVFRLILLPFYVLNGSWFHALEEVGRYNSMEFLHGLVGVLLILHVWWFYLIVKIIYNKVVLDVELDDIREDDEEDKEAIEEAARQVKAKALAKGGKAN